MIPSLLLVDFYLSYFVFKARTQPNSCPPAKTSQQQSTIELLLGLLPVVILISLYIIGGCYAKQLPLSILQDALMSTVKITSMVFMILIGATLFSLVFRGFGGDELVQQGFNYLPGGKYTALFVVMVCIFLLAFILDFIEITFVVVPIVGPILLMMGFDPIWLGIMLAVNLQTSFLTPPFGFALFYLRGVVPDSISTSVIYRGVIPFIMMQLTLLFILALFPVLTTWLPNLVNT